MVKIKSDIINEIMHPTEIRQPPLLSVISKTDRFELNANNTIYRAEGNANLVLSMVDTKRVVRLRKAFVGDNILSKDTSSHEDSSYDLKRTIDYIKFISLLVGDSYAIQPEMVYLEIHDYDYLNNDWLMKFRPADRLEKIIKCQNGTLYPDVTFLPDELNFQKALQENNRTTTKTYCIEIKPKQGWLVEPDLSIANGEIFQRLDYDEPVKCRYCTLQYYKLEKGRIKHISKYCPVDLFSGNPHRMVRTLKGLAKSPQNNFRFFENGTIIYDESCDKKSLYSCLNNIFGHHRTSKENFNLFVNVLRETLLKDFMANDSETNRIVYNVPKNKRKKKVHIHLKRCDRNNSSKLPENCALKRLLDIQLLSKSSLSQVTVKKFEEMFTENNLYIDDILLKVNGVKKAQQATGDGEKDAKRNHIERYMKPLTECDQYMLGATALDCSMMVTFRKLGKYEAEISDEEIKKHIITFGHSKFLTNVTIMDLDPKATTHYEKMIRQLNASHAAYKSYLRTQVNRKCE